MRKKKKKVTTTREGKATSHLVSVRHTGSWIDRPFHSATQNRNIYAERWFLYSQHDIKMNQLKTEEDENKEKRQREGRKSGG